MVKVIFHVPVDIIDEDGAVAQNELIKTIDLPESPRTDIIYQDDDLDAIISSIGSSEVLVSSVTYDICSKTYVAHCEKNRISANSYNDSKNRTGWKLITEPARKSTWAISE